MNVKKITVSTQITAEERERILQYCKENDETMSRVLRKIIRRFLAELEQQE